MSGSVLPEGRLLYAFSQPCPLLIEFPCIYHGKVNFRVKISQSLVNTSISSEEGFDPGAELSAEVFSDSVSAWGFEHEIETGVHTNRQEISMRKRNRIENIFVFIIPPVNKCYPINAGFICNGFFLYFSRFLFKILAGIFCRRKEWDRFPLRNSKGK